MRPRKAKFFCTLRSPPFEQSSNLKNGKTFTNYKSDRGVATGIHKEFLETKYHANNPFKLEYRFKQSSQTMKHKRLRHALKTFNFLSCWVMQNKMTTLRFYLKPARRVKVNKININSFWQGCRERGTLTHLL